MKWFSILVCIAMLAAGCWQQQSPPCNGPSCKVPPAPSASTLTVIPVAAPNAPGLSIVSSNGTITISAALPSGTVQNIRALPTATPGVYATEISWYDGTAAQLVDGPTITVGTVPGPGPSPTPAPPAPQPPPAPPSPGPTPPPTTTVSLVEVSRTDCSVCNLLDGAVQQLVRQGYAVSRVNVDQDPTAQAKYNPTAFPTWIMLANGRELHRETGGLALPQLKQWLDDSKSYAAQYLKP